MAKLVYGLMQSLDGYVDRMKLGPPVPAVSRHFLEEMRGLTGLIYGRRTYVDHALLGRRSSRLGRGGPRLRGGVAEPAEVGHVAFPQVRWPQRHADRGRLREDDTQAEG